MTRCRPLAVVIVAFLVLAEIGSKARAQADDSLNSYRFVPRLSTLHQTGGFAGFDVRYIVRGTYDFVQEDIEPWLSRVKFADVDAWASSIEPGPTPAYVLSLDETLNMSGLVGRQLPVAAPFDVFSFEGKTGDGSAVRLLAAKLGPWMTLRGETKAPADSADVPEYQLHGVARQLPSADLNVDGLVDKQDLATWGQDFAASLSYGAGLLAWQRQAGEAVPEMTNVDAMLGAILASPTIGAVPEPTAGAIAVAGLACFARRRR